MPSRLELKDVHACGAREMEVGLVTTDSHAPERFALVPYGFGVGRRAWRQPEHIYNTRPVDESFKCFEGADK